MASSLPSLLCVLLLSLLPLLSAQSSSSGGAVYTGYSLSSSGDPASTTYQTDDVPAAVPQSSPPDVHLNATVHVTEIDLTVSNITAKINLDAQVLNLLQFNAGVSASIDRVRLLVQEVDAEVLLEARLENLVLMIGDVLDSIDLNPVIATLAGEIGNAVTDLGNDLSSSSSTAATPAVQVAPLSPMATVQPIANDIALVDNILYSINDYSGATHTNRVLLNNGSIADERLDANGRVLSTTLVGQYKSEMTYSGHTTAATVDGQAVEQQEWLYTPFAGLSVVCVVDVNADTGLVVSAQVVSESFGGGESTITTP